MRCCVPHCSSADHVRHDGISFHRFPKNEKMRNKWLRNIPRRSWTPGKRDVICSRHFDPRCIDSYPQKRRVHEDALPIYFDPPPLPKQQSNTKSNTIVFTRTIEYVDDLGTTTEVIEVVTDESTIESEDKSMYELYEIIEFEDAQ